MTRTGAVNTRRASLWIALAVLVLTAGCSTTFFYNRLDTLVPWYLRARVTLEDRQLAELRHSVSSLTSWHRSSQLTRYSTFLRDVSEETRHRATREGIERTSQTIEAYWKDFIVEFAPGASKWLQSLSPEQLDELLASYVEDDEDLAEDYCKASGAKLHARRVKALTRSVKYWIGSVGNAQRAIIDRAARELRRTDCDWLESRVRWRAELKTALLSGDQRGEVDQRVQELLIDPRRSWTDAYIEGSKFNRERVLDMLLALDASVSDKQRQAMQRRLNDLASDLDELAKQES